MTYIKLLEYNWTRNTTHKPLELRDKAFAKHPYKIWIEGLMKQMKQLTYETDSKHYTNPL